jgi:hypothetical protein
MKPVLAISLEPVDPLVGCLTGDTEPFCEFGDGVVVQLVIFEESLSLFTHGNTFPGHGKHLLHEEVLPMSLEFVLPMSPNGSPGEANHSLEATWGAARFASQVV